MTTEPAPTESRHLSTLTSLLGVIAAVVAAATMKIAAAVLIPLVLAIFLSYLLAPIMGWLGRHHVPEALTLPVTLVLLVGVLFVLEVFVSESVSEIAQRAPYYADRFEQITTNLVHKLGPRAAGLAQVNWIEQITGATSDLTVSVFGSLINFAAKLVLVATYLVFILLGRKSLAANLARAYPEARAAEILGIFEKVNLQVQRYVVTKILLSLATGLCMYIALKIFGVDFALFWGMLGFLLNFIPTVGSAIAAVLPITLSALQFDSLVTVLGVALSLIGIQQIIGNLVEPAIQGRQLNMSPIVVLFALVFFGWLWGFWGMVLSVPLMAVLKIVLEHNETLRPLAVMLEK